jgi:hypothetical protein
VNRAIFLSGIYFITLLISGCSSTAPLCLSDWQDKPVVVDGKATEWTIPLRLYDNATKLNYFITNNDTTLYYCIRITDDKEEMRAMLAGMQIWIDTTGKTQHQVGIQFPLTQVIATIPDGKKQPSFSDSTQGGSGKLDDMRLVGFKYPIGGVIPTLNTYGIKVKIARDSTGVTIYEGCIPFRTFYRNALSAVDNGKTIGMTIVINPMSASAHKERKSHGGDGNGYSGPGGMSMGMGGMGGGGGRRGGRSQQNDEGEDESNTGLITLKMQLQLSAK